MTLEARDHHSAPSERRSLSLKNWLKLFLKDIRQQFLESQILLTASSLAYTTILSVIPILALSFAIFQAFGGMEKLYSIIEPFILQNLAEGSGEEVIGHMRKYIGNVHAGAVGAGGFIGLIVTCMSMFSSIEKAINRIWRSERSRTLFHRFAVYWLLITLGPMAIAVALGAATSSNVPLANLFPSGTGIFLIINFILFATYKWVPTRHVNWRPALVSSFVTTLMWNCARLGYALYTKKVVTYNKIYGSLGAIPILLLWIYISWIVVMTGAALTATLQKRLELK